MKKSRFFIIKLPNGDELLFRTAASSWIDMAKVVKYFDRAYDDGTYLYSISWFDAIKFLFKKHII